MVLYRYYQVAKKTMETKKITMATVKSFINKNFDNLYIKNLSSFDGMTDSVVIIKELEFKKVSKSVNVTKSNMGVSGAWFVGQSRDYCTAWENEQFKGFEVYNCCGSFILAIKK